MSVRTPGATCAPASAISVVLVDDTPDIRVVVRMALERAGGFEVVGEAGNGIEGLAQVAELQPDVVLLDMAMPEMDGLQAAPLIRQACPGAKVVMFSGFRPAEMRGKALMAGAHCYLQKNGSLKAMVNEVRDCVHGMAC